MRDVSEGEACPTDSGFIANQDRATIAKSSTLPHDTAPRVTSPAAVQGNDAPIKGKRIDEEEGVTGRVSSNTEEIRMDEGEVVVERTSEDIEEMATVLTSMDAATVLAGGIDIPTGSYSIPTTGPHVVDIHTGSDAIPTASPIVATTTVVTPYSRRKGKEVMVESVTPKKQRLKEQIDTQVARELEEQQEREDKRMTEQIARDAEVARIHAKEELQESTEKTMDQKAEEGLLYDCNQKQLRVEGKRLQRLKRKRFNLEQEKAKKQKTSEEVSDIEKSPEEIPEEKVHIEGQRSYWKIIRLGGSSACYQFFVDLLKHLDREDLNQLWVLVKEYLSIRLASSDKEIELWVELKRLYEPDPEDQLVLIILEDPDLSFQQVVSEPAVKFVKAAERSTSNKVEAVKKPSVRYAELYRKPSKKSTVRGNQRNWNNLKDYSVQQSPCLTRQKIISQNFQHQAVQTIIPNNATFQTKDLDTYDSDCDDLSHAQAVLMTNISNYGSDVILEVPQSETYLNDTENQSVLEMHDFEQPPAVDSTDNEIHSDSNIILKRLIRKNNESLTAELERYKERVKIFKQRLKIDLSSHEKMIDSQMDDMIKEKLALKEQVDLLEQNLSKQIKEKECLFKPSDALLVKIEAPKELSKISLVNEIFKKLKFHLAKFDSVGIVEQAKAKQPLDNTLDFACYPDCSLVSGLWMFETHDRELLSAQEICFEESPITPTFHDDPLNESPHEDSTSQVSSSNILQIHTLFEHLGRWTKDHPIANMIRDHSRSVSMRKQLQTNAMWCFFDVLLTSVESKNFKQAVTEPSWIDAMQEEIYEFERLQV
nr:hypothetical protein [Tanacetum cinerariifolium]